MNSSKKSPDYNIREKPLFATLVIGFVVTIFTMLLVYFNVIDLGSSSVDLIDVSVTCLAFYVSLKIAKIQSDTAKKIETIGTDTGKTAREILRRKGIEELVSSFFKIQPDKISKYKCVYPQEYPWKGPLPAIRLGDHYALRNIESWFGEDRVEFIGIQRKFTDDPQRKGKETRRIIGKTNKESAIFVCEKTAHIFFHNSFDIEIGPTLPLFGDEKTKTLPLPCWFEKSTYQTKSDKPADSSNDPPQIAAKGGLEPLPSPSEHLYGKSQGDEAIQEDESLTLVDFGILCRIKKKDSYNILIAGIHQIGTYVTAEFISRLLMNQEDIAHGKERDAMLSDNDFIAVIRGELDQQTRKIIVCKIYPGYFWTKSDKAAEWSRIF